MLHLLQGLVQVAQLREEPSSHFPLISVKIINYLILPSGQEQVGEATALVPVPLSPLQDRQF